MENKVEEERGGEGLAKFCKFIPEKRSRCLAVKRGRMMMRMRRVVGISHEDI